MSIQVSTSRDKLERNYPQKTRNAQRKRMRDAMGKGFATSQQEAPEDRGTLRQSGYQPEWVTSTRIEWGYTAPYALAQDQGTDPYTPPLKPLLEWGKRVANDPGAGAGAWQKIREEGIEAKEYAQDGIKDTKRYLNTKSFSDYFNREQ